MGTKNVVKIRLKGTAQTRMNLSDRVVNIREKETARLEARIQKRIGTAVTREEKYCDSRAGKLAASVQKAEARLAQYLGEVTRNREARAAIALLVTPKTTENVA